MRYDTRQDDQAQPRYGGPPPNETREEPRPGYAAPVEEEARDEPRPGYGAPAGEEAREEASPRYEPPAWHDAETTGQPAPAAPSDLDAAEPEPVSPRADDATPVDTGAPPVAVGTAKPEEEAVTLWPPDAVHDFQQRWREVQLRFVDDPRAAADEAQELVSEVLDRFSSAVTTRKSELDGWRDADGADTERMRTVVRRYRKLLDRLLEV